jgi:hypothetical protein
VIREKESRQQVKVQVTFQATPEWKLEIRFKLCLPVIASNKDRLFQVQFSELIDE